MNGLVNKYKNNLVIVCFPESKEIYEFMFPDAEYILINHSDFFIRRIAKPGIVSKIKSIEPKVIYDFTGSVLSSSIIFWYKAAFTYGFNLNHFRGLYDKFIPVRRLPHLMDLFYDVMELDGDVYSREYKFKSNGSPTGQILLHPFAGWEAKEWGFDNFVALAELLSSNYECSFIVPQRSLSEENLNKIKQKKINLIETTSIRELFDKIKDCSAFISNDSGPLYIASLCGKPTFTIYGPTNPLFSVPFGEHHGYVRKLIKCSPTGDNQYCHTNAGRKGCPSFLCMNTLTLNEVCKELLPFLEDHIQEKSR